MSLVVPHQGIEVIVQHSEMIIRGTEDLVDAVSRALLLLDNVPEHRTEVDEHMRLITASPLSYSYALLPGMEFYICQRDLEEGHVWCAGQICHDAMHMHLFDAFLRKKERLFTSEEEEKICLLAQGRCLEALGYAVLGVQIQPETFADTHFRRRYWENLPAS